jgi:hypothetical protein
MSFKSIGHYQGDGGMSLENRPDQCFNATEEVELDASGADSNQYWRKSAAKRCTARGLGLAASE